MLTTLLMLAPLPNYSIVCPSGNIYTSDSNSIISNVATFADQQSLSAAGCRALVTQPNGLLFKLLGANFNSGGAGVIGDQALISYVNNKFRITKITSLNTSVNGMSTAQGGFYTAAGKTGTTIVSAAQAYTGLTNAATALDLTLAAPTATFVAGTPLYLSLTTPQGVTATADVYVFGDVYT